MQVRLLGPVDVTVDGVARQVNGVRRKAVLAVLGLHAGQIVSTDRLIDVVWERTPPSTAVNTLQSHVSQLRRVFGAHASIVARPPGYLLDLGSGATDVAVAERLVDAGLRAGTPGASAAQLRAALLLWRGRPLADVAGVAGFGVHIQHLERLRLTAERALAQARLAMGEHEHLIADLERLATLHPFDEELHGQLMLALYRCGRQADALGAYQRLRAGLADALGIDPGAALRDLMAAMLRQDPSLDLRDSAVASRRPDAPADPPPAPAAHPTATAAHPTAAAGHQATPVPAQLPAVVAAFAGRVAELAGLDALLTRVTGGGAAPATVVISAVSGTAGVGKTALALTWAHRVAGAFPDGQLYANLRGYDPSGVAADPATVVRGFLDALGVPAERIPPDPDAQVGLYRSLLASRQMLVLLDNARNADQVRRLLPGAPGCLALVTSRDQLTPLVTAEGAHPLVLDLLTPAEAGDLLADRLGAARTAAEPQAVATLIDRCARLPLALAIVAARAATHPAFPLARLAVELHDSEVALDAMSGGDAATDVRAVLSWSYGALTPGAARLFRLLGLAPGPDITAPAAASLAAVRAGEVRAALAELCRANLVTEHAPGRYTFHDLLRAYAAELAAEEPAALGRAAAVRVLDHYLHTAAAADAFLAPCRDRFPLPAPAAGVTPQPIAGHDAARAWFAAEHMVLLAAVERAAAGALDVHAWQLAWAATTFLDRWCHWSDLAAAHRTALVAATGLGQATAQAYAHRGLGLAAQGLGRITAARAEFTRALRLFAQDGDVSGQALTHMSLATVCDRDRPADAVAHAELSLRLYRLAGSASGQATALNNMGWYNTERGRYAEALEQCSQALELQRQIGDTYSQAHTLDSLGYIHRHLGDHAQAVACYRRSLELFRQTGDPYSEAVGLSYLGDVHEAAGEFDDARLAWSRALITFEQADHPDAERLRKRLDQLPGTGPGR